jgi:hypothetical protein
MDYKLTVKLMEEKEISKDCPFPPEEDDFEMYLQSLVEDINSISAVLRAEIDTENQGCISIKTNGNTSESQLRAAMKPIFSSFFCKIRYESLIQS